MRRRQFREPFFEIAQLTVKRVVFAIANRRRRFFVIAAVMLLDLAPQLHDTFGCLLFIQDHG